MSNRKLYVELNKERDGESKRMACHKVVYSRQPYSTSTPTTRRSTMEPGASSTQTIYVSRSSVIIQAG